MLGCTPKCTLYGDKHLKIVRLKKVNCTGNDNCVLAAESTPRSATIDQKTTTSVHNGRNGCTIAAEKGHFYAQMDAPNCLAVYVPLPSLVLTCAIHFFSTFLKMIWYTARKGSMTLLRDVYRRI